MDSLSNLFRNHTGKVSDKWDSYVTHYDQVLNRYRKQPIRLLEIGVQNGGSLEIWSKFFPNAQHIIGCDIDPQCGELKFEDPRISIVVGDATDKATFSEIRRLSDSFDIVIDDGSHRSDDIVKSFGLYFPLVVAGGMYIAEDLWCSYNSEYEGGIEHPASSVNFFKRLADLVNFEFWGEQIAADVPLSYFADTWQAEFNPDHVQRIEEVRFRNSLVTILKGDTDAYPSGKRCVVGSEALADDQHVKQSEAGHMSSLQSDNPFGPHATRLEKAADQYNELKAKVHDYELRIDQLQKMENVANTRLTSCEALLMEARNQPLKQLHQKLLFWLLGALSKASPPLSSRTAARFAHSAEKRDPKRGAFSYAANASKNLLDYPSVIKAWESQRQKQQEKVADLAVALKDAPLFSIVVPVYNTDPVLLEKMIESVCNQTYKNWELCVADDCSPNEAVRDLLKRCSEFDKRIKVTFREENGHISAATNSAIELASGEFIALLGHDDLLDPDALLLIAKAISENPNAMIIYTDEDNVSEQGERYNPHFKPDWDHLLACETNYVRHFSIYKADLVRQVKGFREGLESAQDHDFLLRCVEHVHSDQIRHVSKVLYSRRATAKSTASSKDAQPYASEAGRRAVEQHLERYCKKHILVQKGPFPFSYKPCWPVLGEPLVSIIIPTRDQLEKLRIAVDSVLEKTVYTNYEILIIDNNSQAKETIDWLDKMQTHDARVRVIRDNRPFNYSALNNAAVAESTGEFVLLLNNDVEVISPDWLSEMLALAQLEKAGCIGAKLYYPNQEVQHAGVVIGMGGVAGHVFKNATKDDDGYFGRLKVRQHYSAVTAACLLVRRTVYDEVGGLNEKDLAVAFNDVDFCLKVKEAGYRNMWTPYAELYHHESVSRGYEDTKEKMERFKRERFYLQSRWKTDIYRDPAYNINLSKEKASFTFGPPIWEV